MLSIDLILNIKYYSLMKDKNKKMFFSTSEVAKLLKVTRITIFQRIKNGSLKAEKFGRNYLIPREEIEHYLSDSKKISETEKIQIQEAVERAVKEYGEAIRLLGRE